MKAWWPLVLVAALLAGCTSKVLVTIPPKIDLQPYKTIGIVEFTSDETGRLNQFATQKFMNVVQASQPNVRFLEVAPADQVLITAVHQRVDPEVIKGWGARYNVETLFTGVYEISSLKPQVTIGQDMASVKAGVTVTISLALKHWDTRTGAIVWTNSRQGRWPVASVKKGAGHPVSVSVSDPTDRYPQFMAELINVVADDFRTHYEWRPAPKP
ncbi:MAG: hypothetical protein ACREJ9_10865 [Candidatus Rokuibacteriota bacterium]